MVGLEDFFKLTPEQLNQLGDSASGALKKIGEAADSSTTQLNKMSDSTGKLSQLTNSATTALNSANKTLNEGANSFSKFIKEMNLENIEAFSQSIVSYTQNMSEASNETIEAAVNVAMLTGKLAIMTKVIGSLPQNKIFDGVISESKIATANTGELIDSLMSIGNVDSNSLAGIFLSGAKVSLAAADSVRKMETGLISVMASSGQLNQFLDEVGSNFDRMEPKLTSFIEKNTLLGNRVGLNTSTIGKYASELLMIPGAIDDNIQLTADGTETVSAFEAALRVGAGTGQSFGEVVKQMSENYLDFNTSTQDALQNVSRLSVVTQSLGLPLELSRNYVDQTAKAFKYFGDNTQGAINILNRVGPALKESGLGPRAIQEMTQSISNNISQMSLAQRSFLSMQTGGPGGLRGGYQIELLKSQGKIDQIQKLTEEALKKQFGGQIVTLEQAASDESAARQLAKQVQLVTQGPTKVVDTEAQAYKLFEAMQKGMSSAEIAGPQEALRESFETGKAIQERQRSELVSINNELEKVSAYANIIALNTSKDLERGVAGIMGYDLNELQNLNNARSQDLQNLQFFTKNKPQAPTQQTVAEKFEDFALGGIKGLSDRMGFDIQEYVSKLVPKKTKDEIITIPISNPNILDNNINPDIYSKNINPSDIINNNIPPNIPNMNNIIKQFDDFKQNSTVDMKSKSENNVTLHVQCPECMKKSAQDIAIKIVDGKMQAQQQGEVLHNHIGFNPGF